ncbi:hypothetical protein LNA01_01390 [Companilactobacillus nantensis]|nr:hypothetical protein LNA01_01390 [Companilactobacillus nantensis]
MISSSLVMITQSNLKSVFCPNWTYFYKLTEKKKESQSYWLPNVKMDGCNHALSLIISSILIIKSDNNVIKT